MDGKGEYIFIVQMIEGIFITMVYKYDQNN